MENVCNFPFRKLFQIIWNYSECQKDNKELKIQKIYPQVKDNENQRIWAESRAQYSSPHPVDIKNSR